MSLVLKSIFEAFAGTFFEFLAGVLKDMRTRNDQIALGAETEKATQAASAIETKEAMTQEHLRPRSTSEVKKRLKEGTF
jgi:hypothetical protein